MVDGAPGNSSPVSFGFAASLNRLLLNTTYSGYVSYYTPVTYPIHLEQAAILDIDAQNTDSRARWTLSNANKVVFDSRYMSSDRDPIPVLAAGDYTLRIFSGYSISSPYQFRVLTEPNAEVANAEYHR